MGDPASSRATVGIALGVIGTCNPLYLFKVDIRGVVMDDKQAKRKAQNMKAAQKSYQAKKTEREDLRKKHSELQDSQMQLLHDKCRLEEQIKLLEYVYNSMDHSRSKCVLCKASVMTQTPLELVSEDSITDDDCNNDNNLCDDNSDVLDLSMNSELTIAAPIVFSGAGSLIPSSKSFPKKKRVTFETKPSNVCDEHIMDPASYLAVGATQDVYLEPSVNRAGKMDAISTSSSSTQEVFVPSAKRIKLIDVPVSHLFKGCASDVMRKQYATPFAETRGTRFSAS